MNGIHAIDDSSFESDSDQDKVRALNERLTRLSSENRQLQQKNQELESRIQTSREEFVETTRQNTRMQSRIQAMEIKIEGYETQIKNLQEELAGGSSNAKKRESQIEAYRNKLKESESMSLKHRQDFLQFIAERKQLTDNNNQMAAHIKDLDKAIKDLMEQNQSLSKSFAKSEERNRQLHFELEQEQHRSYMLEQELSNTRNPDRGYDVHQVKETASSQSIAETQKQLIIAKNTIKELELKNEKLRGYEEKAAKMEIAVQQYKSKVQKLKKTLEDKEMELEPLRGRTEKYSIQIEEMRENERIITETAEEQLNFMNEEIVQYVKKIDEVTDLCMQQQTEIEQKQAEISELKEELRNYETGKYGLVEAVAQARQLKTLVSVRDAFIADLVNEIDVYQRIIALLEPYLPPNFDFEAFYEEVMQKQTSEAQKHTERKANEILKDVLGKHKNRPLGSAKIVVTGSDGKQKALLMNMPPSSMAENKSYIHEEEESYEEDYEEEEEEKGSKLMKVFSKHNFARSSSKHVNKDISFSLKKQTLDASVQTDKEELPDPFEKLPMSPNDQDEWVRNLHQKYTELKALYNKLKQKAQGDSQKVEELEKENSDLQLKIEDLTKEIKGLTEAGNDHDDTWMSSLRVKKSVVATQTSGNFLKLEESKSIFFNKYLEDGIQLMVGGSLAYPSDDLEATLEEREKNETLLLSKLQTKVGEQADQLDELKRSIKKKDDRIKDLENLLQENQATVALLQTKLDEQRQSFKEKFVNLKNEADRYVEQRVKDALELRAVQDQNAAPYGGSDGKLKEVSAELRNKNAKIQELLDKIQEKDDLLHLAEAQRDNALRQLTELQMLKSETTSLSSSQIEATKGVNEYNGELRMKYTHLQKKYNALLKEYNAIKKSRSEHGSFADTGSSASAADNDTMQKELAKARAYKSKVREAEAKVDELQKLLKKANNTIAQLNELLQRKESKLERLNAQVAQLKQQNAALVQKK